MPAASVTRITIEPGKRGGKPCVRGLRITVWDVLRWLGAGMTEEQIPRLTSLFPGLTHVSDLGLREADDKTIWDWARQNSYTL